MEPLSDRKCSPDRHIVVPGAGAIDRVAPLVPILANDRIVAVNAGVEPLIPGVHSGRARRLLRCRKRWIRQNWAGSEGISVDVWSVGTNAVQRIVPIRGCH